jgi:hypothetical protein
MQWLWTLKGQSGGCHKTGFEAIIGQNALEIKVMGIVF